MNIKYLKIDNECHIVTYTVWGIHVLVTPQGYTILSDYSDHFKDYDYEDAAEDTVETLDSLNAAFQRVLQLQ